MKTKLSLIMITRNSGDFLAESLKSVKNLVQEIIIVDDNSKDKTVKIAKRFKARVYNLKEPNLGKKRAYALSLAKGEWVLALDADEVLSIKLKNEIKDIIKGEGARVKAYKIPFQNHFLGRPVNHGGENYQMLRLFKKNAVTIKPNLIHERFEIKKGEVSILKNKIYHYSYRAIPQMFKKFTDYAIREAKEKHQKKEKVNLQKIFLYPPHMFYARYIKDKGYRDGLFRIPLDMGFAYMEFMTYILLLIFNLKK